MNRKVLVIATMAAVAVVVALGVASGPTEPGSRARTGPTTLPAVGLPDLRVYDA